MNYSTTKNMALTQIFFCCSGGSCALVALFMLNKVYVANAGDCRSCIYDPSQPILVPMSYDFTPESDRQRIQMIAYQRPELLRHPITKEKLYNRHVLSRKVRADEVGVSTVMYRDFYMAGWSCRDVTADDARLVPLITGRGKQCRLLSTVGVARGLGDHDLVVRSSMVNCKEFLTCQPEVRVKHLDELDPDSILVMGSDGLWDVMTNANVYNLIGEAVREYHQAEEGQIGDRGQFCQTITTDLILEARGTQVPDGYWEKKSGDMASGDDITCIAVDIGSVKQFLNPK
jgi:serine/threonine protein phosphatase PrpC